MKAESAGIVNDSKKPQKKRVIPRSAALSWTNGNLTATMKRAEKRKPVTRRGRAFPFRTLSRKIPQPMAPRIIPTWTAIIFCPAATGPSPSPSGAATAR
jgi:hypothetical protein